MRARVSDGTPRDGKGGRVTAKAIAGWAGLTSGGDHHFILKQRGCGLAHPDVAFVGIVARGAHHEHKEARPGVPLQPDVQCGHQPDEYHEVRLKPVHIRDQHIRGLLELLGAQQLKLFLVPGPVVRSAQRKVIVEPRPSPKSLLRPRCPLRLPGAVLSKQVGRAGPRAQPLPGA